VFVGSRQNQAVLVLVVGLCVLHWLRGPATHRTRSSFRSELSCLGRPHSAQPDRLKNASSLLSKGVRKFPGISERPRSCGESILL
jgi:hypothetical protein